MNSSNPESCPLSNVDTNRVEHGAVVASKLSHDFGNYLTGIMGFTELSLQQAPPGGTLERFLQEVLQSARAGADWIRRLHHFCKRTNIPGWPGCIDLAVSEEKTRLSRERRNDLEWAIDLPAGLPMVATDAESLGVILSELTANTSESCGGKGTFAIRARTVTLSEPECGEWLGSPTAGNYVEWSVCDDGPAIGTSVREKLFNELFFSTKPKHRGLGLWMIYGVIKRHGGGVKLASPWPERGFGVSMALPVAQVPIFGQGDNAPMAVLVMLGNAMQGKNMARLLETGGCTPTVASSPLEGQETLITQPGRYSVAIVETQLGGESGLTFARRILEKHPTQRFVFVHPQLAYHELPEEDLAKRFPVLRGPLEMTTFFQAVRDAIRADTKKGK